MGALDIATKPAQIAIGMVKMLLLFIILLVVLMGYPFYMYFTGQPVTNRQIECAITALLFILSFVASPLYTAGVTFMFFIAYCTPVGDANLFPCIVLFLGFGIVLRGCRSDTSDDTLTTRTAELPIYWVWSEETGDYEAVSYSNPRYYTIHANALGQGQGKILDMPVPEYLPPDTNPDSWYNRP
jgi:hypothetical protein